MRKIMALAGIAIALTEMSLVAAAEVKGPLAEIDHIVVIYQENWSFDGLFGKFPGAEGLEHAARTGRLGQIHLDGTPMKFLPTPSTDRHIPAGLPAEPFDIAKYVQLTGHTGDMADLFYLEQFQIHGGRMDRYVAGSDNGSLVLSYYDASDLPSGKLAKQYVLCGSLFHGAFGGSFLNHQFLVAAAAPHWNQPMPPKFKSTLRGKDQRPRDANLTCDGRYVVNTTQPAQDRTAPPCRESGWPPSITSIPRPPITCPPSAIAWTTKIAWRWYSGGWNDAVAGHAGRDFQYHHQPFAYYAKYAPLLADGKTRNPATTGADARLQDEKTFFTDLKAHRLPAVSFIKLYGADNEHPGYAALVPGMHRAGVFVEMIQASPEWRIR